jgi:F-type H+-transporting ATPase subunit delta
VVGKKRKAVDFNARQVAGVYARALVGAGQESGTSERLVNELESLVADVFDAHPQLERLLLSGVISESDRHGILDRVFTDRISPMLLAFLKVVSHHGRLGYLREIARQARQRFHESQGRIRVEVETAAELSEPLRSEIAQTIRGALQREPDIELSRDARLIGGIVVRVGDKVFDGSVANRLERLRQQMVQRCIEEIELRRDRFVEGLG